MPIYYNILVAEFLAREHGPVLFWLILPWNSHYLSLEEAGGGEGWVSGDFGYITWFSGEMEGESTVADRVRRGLEKIDYQRGGIIRILQSLTEGSGLSWHN